MVVQKLDWISSTDHPQLGRGGSNCTDEVGTVAHPKERPLQFLTQLEWPIFDSSQATSIYWPTYADQVSPVPLADRGLRLPPICSLALSPISTTECLEGIITNKKALGQNDSGLSFYTHTYWPRFLICRFTYPHKQPNGSVLFASSWWAKIKWKNKCLFHAPRSFNQFVVFSISLVLFRFFDKLKL